MTARTAQHGTIRLERRYKAPPARVFAAWAEPKARAKWDVPGRWVIAEQSFDFREGGRELKRFGPKDDPRFVTDTLYLDIVPQRRIVFSYSMTSRGTPISVSLT
ncbi:MAG TPA: SRPBCC domain-containing protein, partial [Reyranella sp.]